MAYIHEAHQNSIVRVENSIFNLESGRDVVNHI